MKCEICKAEYDNNLENCPYCGLANPSYGTKHCTNCGQTMDTDERFCSSCGSLQIVEEPPKNCSNCDAPLKPGAAFCSQCGTPVGSSAVAPSPVPTTPVAPPPVTQTREPVAPVRQPAPVDPYLPDVFPQRSEPNPATGSIGQKVTTSMHDQLFAPEPQPVSRAEAPIVNPPPSRNVPVLNEQPPLIEGTSPPSKKKRRKSKDNSSDAGYDPNLSGSEEKDEGSKATIFILIGLIVLVIGVLAFMWFVLIPNSLKGSAPAGAIETAAGAANGAELGETQSGANALEGATNVNVIFPYKAVDIIPAEWDDVSSFDENGLARVMSGSTWGLIDKQGQPVAPPIYDSISPFSENLATVITDEKYGFIDINGSVIIPIEYNSATAFSEGFALVSKDDRYYYVNTSNELKDYGGHLSTPFNEGVAAVLSLESSYFINTFGEKISKDYDEAGIFSNGYAPVRMNDKWGYVDSSFELVLDYEFEEAGSFVGGAAIVKRDGKKFLIDPKGEQVSPPVDEIWQFKEDPTAKNSIATVKNSGLYGFVDGKSQEFLVEPQYTNVYAFSEGKAAVSINAGIWYYVDVHNIPAFVTQFDEAYRFNDGLACVKQDMNYTLIDGNGENAIENNWAQVGTFSQNILPVQIDGKWGFVEIVPNSK